MSDNVALFEQQKKIYPRRVWGKFRKVKWVAMVLLLGIYYLVPWLRWDRGAYAPNQAILIDIDHARAYFFGIEIWPQEIYYIAGMLILAAVGLFFVTSLFGRIWCGYACPQTVWTDLFVWVERIVQGDRNARKKLDESPWTLEKITKKSITHLIWLFIGLCTGGAWVFYFNDAPTLAEQIMHMEVPLSVSGWIIGLTCSTYLMAGFAREQVCTYMCPYARFQSAMFDKDTLIVAYDENRGEPRGKHKAGQSWEGKGHCVDCTACVVVCPMGIDIRQGLQMECIACGLCADACNNVMAKIGLPQGLIRYDTESKKPLNLLRPRSFWYGGIIAVVGGIMLYTLLTRSPLELAIVHDRNPVFVTLSNGDIRNGYTVTILNKTYENHHYQLQVVGLENAVIRVQSNQDIPADNLAVSANNIQHFRVFITSSAQEDPRKKITFAVTEQASKIQNSKETIFVSKDR